jgi:hypothetical protein
MQIKMPVRFFGSYQVTVRSGDQETKERCQKLTFIPIAGRESPSDAAAPTFQIIFHDAGCRRIIQGTLKENLDQKTVFQVEEKEYEFSPL